MCVVCHASFVCVCECARSLLIKGGLWVALHSKYISRRRWDYVSVHVWDSQRAFDVHTHAGIFSLSFGITVWSRWEYTPYWLRFSRWISWNSHYASSPQKHPHLPRASLMVVMAVKPWRHRPRSTWWFFKFLTCFVLT